MKDTNQLVKPKLKSRTRRKIYGRYGAEGMKLLCAVYRYTRHRTLCIGRIKDIKILCRNPEWTVTQTLRLIEQSGLFVVDREKDVFYSPDMRRYKKLSVKPTAKEINIAMNTEDDILIF